MEFLESLLEPLGMEGQADTVLAAATNVLIAMLILIVGFWIAGRVGAVVRGIGKQHQKLDDTLFNFLGSLARYVVLAFVVIAVLNRFGVETTSIVALLGAAGLAVGLALQGAMSNLAAGVMLMIFRPFKLEQYIEAGGHAGTVKGITLFTTEMATPDNVQIIVPNGQAWGSIITNFSHHDTRRVDLVFGIDYEDVAEKAMQIVLDWARADSRVMGDPEPWVRVTNLGGSSVDITSRIWVQAADFWDVKFDMTKGVKEAFDKGGVSIPYPHTVMVQRAS